ncbi:MAG: hypothetical protein CMO01_30015 [Thalassobius sp.]|nr:hypothetical protein [Thalassovita sp.]
MNNFKSGLKSVNYYQLFFDLIIVFIGVYAAFVLSDLQADWKKQKETQHILELLKSGVDRYESTFGGFAVWHVKHNQAFRDKLAKSEIPEFGNAYYPAPQYPIDVIDHVLTEESFKVFPVDIYVPLAGFSNAIQRMMYVEEKLVEISERYEPLPYKENPDYERVFRQQRQLAYRYWQYLEKRMNIAQELEKRAKELGEQLNKIGVE